MGFLDSNYLLKSAAAVDLVGTFVGCQAAARQMIDQSDGGAIFNVSSLWGATASSCGRRTARRRLA